MVAIGSYCEDFKCAPVARGTERSHAVAAEVSQHFGMRPYSFYTCNKQQARVTEERDDG